MTYPRAHLIQEDEPGRYHLVSTCVRQAYLCGSDPATGIDYSYRQGWLESRMFELAEYFALDIHAYAVMSNHYHVVVNTDPKRVEALPQEEVARRWVLAMQNPDKPLRPEELHTKVQATLAEPGDRIEILRRRLRSVSWFMSRMNEPMARRCNREDNCKGRFWQGRFYSGALLDESALLKCMVYADLNPVRAGVANDLVDSKHTGVRRRLLAAAAVPESLDEAIRALTPSEHSDGPILGGMTNREYIDLVRWTGENIKHPGKARLPSHASEALRTLGVSIDSWSDGLGAHRHRLRAYGGLAKLKLYARRVGCRFVRGVPSERTTGRSSPQPEA